MGTVTDHQINPANDVLTVTVTDSPGVGGANHIYSIDGFTQDNPGGQGPLAGGRVVIPFQNGPIAEAGVNGLTHEVLLSILCDRMRSFQAGPYASPDNDEALRHMVAAQKALQRRTLARMARGVEGTHKV